MSLNGLIRTLAKKTGIDVYTPEDAEEKLELIRKLEAQAAYQEFMSDFESPDEYFAWVDNQIEQGNQRRAALAT